jgi:hypothetical protein
MGTVASLPPSAFAIPPDGEVTVASLALLVNDEAVEPTAPVEEAADDVARVDDELAPGDPPAELPQATRRASAGAYERGLMPCRLAPWEGEASAQGRS